MAADDARATNFSVRGNNDFDFDLAGNVHALCEFRIGWRDFAFNLALAFVRGGLLGKDEARSKKSGRGCGDADTNPTRSHEHSPSSGGELSQKEKGTSEASAGKRKIGVPNWGEE